MRQVTYTALIGAYERGGEWLRALETFHLVSARHAATSHQHDACPVLQSL